MAQVVLHLLVLKLDRKDLRYVVLGPSDGVPSPTPLFLGADLLEGSGVPAANHCRIHARYSRKGLATKLTFPSDVAIAGVTNVHNGAWFYGLQGVLQLTFEYHNRELQVDIVSKLGDLWKQRSTDPLLPDGLPVSLQQLHQQQQHSGLLLSSGRSGPRAKSDSGIPSPSFENEEPSDELHIHNNGSTQDLLRPNFCIKIDTDIDDHNVGNGCQLHSAVTYATKREKCSLSEFLHNVVIQTSSFIYDSLNENGARDKESTETEGVTVSRALLAFLQILQAEIGSNGDFEDNPSDPGFAPLLEVLIDYRNLVIAPKNSSSSSSRTCSPNVLPPSSGWRIGECYDTLLCLVSEWLGRRLFCFNADIATHMDEFKSRNLNQIHDLPPPQEMVSELFPRCMRLLVGHWIGLYASPTSSNTTLHSTHGDKFPAGPIKEEAASPLAAAVVDNPNPTTQPASSSSGRKIKSVGSQNQSRDDHSYSTLPAIAAVSPIDDSCSHRSAASADDGTLASISPGAAAPPPSKKLRMLLTASGTGDGSGFKDHNYFSSADAIAVAGTNSNTVNMQPPPREDHTYVANPVLTAAEADSAAQPSISRPPTPSTSGNMRKDHTYVATHNRKIKSAANTPTTSASASPRCDMSATPPPTVFAPHMKWLVRPVRCSSSRLRFLEHEVDESKYAFIQIILEFVNNALISGVAHVVYTRLLLS